MLNGPNYLHNLPENVRNNYLNTPVPDMRSLVELAIGALNQLPSASPDAVIYLHDPEPGISIATYDDNGKVSNLGVYDYRRSTAGPQLAPHSNLRNAVIHQLSMALRDAKNKS